MSLASLPIVRGVEAARRSIFQRRRPEEAALSPDEERVIRALFGETLTVEEAVRRIVAAVRSEGDAALRRFSLALDGQAPDAWTVSEEEFVAARAAVDGATLQAMQIAAQRVRAFHERQLAHAATSFDVDGLGQVVRPLRRAGLYVPGTTVVYPSTVLHTAIPAVVAGVEEIYIASPISAGEGGSAGRVSPLKLVAAEIAGVGTIYKVGGAQAIAALAYGTESIPAVDKIFGPGNRFVTLAKRLVFGDVGIDAIYGPTETVVVADDSADPDLCAADLLAQAEHDALAAPILITDNEALAEAVARIVPQQAATLERGKIALAAFHNRGGIVLTASLAESLSLANEYAPEHLALMTRDAAKQAESVRNVGGLFVGESSPEALADYVAGPSHVMPTGGSARYASPLHVGEFLKITTVVQVTEALLQEIGPAAVTIAKAEGLTGHARSLELRRSDR